MSSGKSVFHELRKRYCIFRAWNVKFVCWCSDNEFEDGNHFYRFLEHEPFIPKCYNFRGVVNDSEPKDVAALSRRLTCIMSAILESYASDDRLHLDYLGISNSEEFRRWCGSEPWACCFSKCVEEILGKLNLNFYSQMQIYKCGGGASESRPPHSFPWWEAGILFESAQ